MATQNKRQRSKKILLSAVVVLTVIAGGSSLNAGGPGVAYKAMVDSLIDETVKTLTVYQARRMPNKIYLDAREKAEYNVSHIKSARWVGYEDFKKARVSGIPENATLIVYCSVGYRSEKIGEKLKALGFTDVYNLYGGIFDWVNKGYKVVNLRGRVTDKIHPYSADWGIWLKKGHKTYKP